MKPEIEKIFGNSFSKEISSLLENLGGMTDMIEANFSEIKDILYQHKNDVIKAIKQEIADLKKDLEAKNSEINNLKIKEGQL